ncbi:MAG: hypothetical protein WC759_05525, partial [Candidatus Micrarchaeia archaeon]
MAKLSELSKDWDAWVNKRPAIKDLCTNYPPNLLYRLKSTGQRVTISSYNEAQTLTVSVTGEFNLIDFERDVFGVDPSDLEECELPDEDEELGVTQTPEETLQQINVLRALNGLPPLEETI